MRLRDNPMVWFAGGLAALTLVLHAVDAVHSSLPRPAVSPPGAPATPVAVPAYVPRIREPLPFPRNGSQDEEAALLRWALHNNLTRDERKALALRGYHLRGDGGQFARFRATPSNRSNLSPHDTFTMRNEQSCGSSTCP